MMEKDLNIYVYTQKIPPYGLIEDDCHTPLQVGRAMADEQICAVSDNNGDNISEKNHRYCELTGQYWVWKNAEHATYVGQEHHRRHFDMPKDAILKIMSENDIIAPTPINLSVPIEEHYRLFHIISDLKCCESVIKEKYPEYAEDYDRYIKNGNRLYYANSFIMRWEDYEKYSSFLFGILEEVENRLGLHSDEDWERHIGESEQTSVPNEHSRHGMTGKEYQIAACAFLGERIFTLYVQHNFKKIYHCDLKRLDRIYNMEHMKTMLCCIGRKENQYIREFVEYYRMIGVTNICLYDNNRDGEDDFRDAIGDYIDNGYVILKDYRNITEPCQTRAYNECYAEYKEDYDWFFFFDIDEFLFLNTTRSVNEYLAQGIFEEYDMIHLNWLTFGDGDLVENDGRPLLQRISTPLDVNQCVLYDFPENFHVKSAVRGRLPHIEWGSNAHTPFIEGRCCNGTGIALTDKHSPFVPYDYRMAGLRHFTTKTATEFAEKVERGFCDGNPTPKEKLIELFFKRNKITKEKVDVFKEKCGIDVSYLLPKVFDGEKSKDVKIYSLCYSHKNFDFLDDAVITPLQVGAANGTDVCALKDNVGDHISEGNYFFVECTGTYWIWRNIKDAKYKGQMQYRRPLSGISETTNFEEIFSKYDVITCEPFNHPSHKRPTAEEPMFIPADTVEEGYEFSNCLDDLYILELVIKTYFPEYAEDYDKYIKHGVNLYYSNGFVMRSEDYDRYSDFLFSCLNGYLATANIHSQKDLIEHVKYNLEVGKYKRYNSGEGVTDGAIKWQTEIGGFLSERIWTLWLQHNFPQERIYKTPYIKMEEGMYT